LIGQIDIIDGYGCGAHSIPSICRQQRSARAA
jgi:hypothetical protein